VTVPGQVLVCIGDLIQDVIVWPSGPLAHGTDNPATITRVRGGSAANVSALAASTGAASRFIGRLGDDELGRHLERQMTDAGVEVRVQREGRTGSNVILVAPDGERTMFPDRGAAALLADVPPGWVADAGVVHAPAYSWATPTCAAATLDLFAAGRAAGALVSVDASSVDLILRVGADAVLATLRALAPDVLFANADEAAALSLVEESLPGTSVVVKAGADPVTITSPDGVRTRVAVAPVADVRDTTGAGDAFAAGFLAATLRGASPEQAVTAGHDLAAAVLSHPGASLTRTVPTPNEETP